MTQTIVGSAGSPLDDIALVKVDFHEAHIHRNYTYTVVDIHGDTMKQKTYAFFPDSSGGTTKVIDTFVIRK